jgi:Pvc16 N-terminal domain
MIDTAVRIITDALNDFFEARFPGATLGGDFATPGNIAFSESGSGTQNETLQSGIIVTLVHIEEEKTLKNHPTYIRNGENVEKIRPQLYLNLGLLFSCADDDYLAALQKISIVADFFQSQNVFAPGPGRVTRMTTELVSLSFEQQNHLWGTLGGKQVPALLYKVRLVLIEQAEGQGANVIRTLKDNTQPQAN